MKHGCTGPVSITIDEDIGVIDVGAKVGVDEDGCGVLVLERNVPRKLMPERLEQMCDWSGVVGDNFLQETNMDSIGRKEGPNLLSRTRAC